MNKASTANFWLYWPAKIALTLTPKAFASTTSDTSASTVAQPTCRKLEPTREQVADANILTVDEACVFEVWDRGQAAFPLPGDKLTDPDNNNWIVRSVRKAVFENVHICLCVKMLP